jgi:hypothetical protein
MRGGSIRMEQQVQVQEQRWVRYKPVTCEERRERGGSLLDAH